MPGSRKRFWPAPSHRTARSSPTNARPLGLREYAARPGPAPHRGIDKIAPEMKDLQREQDGSEIKSRELELLTDRVQNLGDRATPSRPCATSPPRDTAPRPAIPGARATGRTAARPANSPRPPSTPATTCAPATPRDLRASARRHPGRLHRRQGLRRRHRHLALAGQHQDQVRRYGPAARRRTRRGEDRGKLGGEERRSPGRLQAELGSRRQGRALPA